MPFLKSELEYCMVCGNPNPQDQPICECGGQNFIFGNDFTYENKELVCNCGCKGFMLSFHMNMSPIHTKNYKCVGCGNIVGIQTYHKSPYTD
jgi:hypothetical protein